MLRAQRFILRQRHWGRKTPKGLEFPFGVDRERSPGLSPIPERKKEKFCGAAAFSRRAEGRRKERKKGEDGERFGLAVFFVSGVQMREKKKRGIEAQGGGQRCWRLPVGDHPVPLEVGGTDRERKKKGVSEGFAGYSDTYELKRREERKKGVRKLPIDNLLSRWFGGEGKKGSEPGLPFQLKYCLRRGGRGGWRRRI